MVPSTGTVAESTGAGIVLCDTKLFFCDNIVLCFAIAGDWESDPGDLGFFMFR